MSPPTRLSSRRDFLKTSAAAVAAPMIVPGSVLGLNGAVPPSERIGLGVMGVGNRAKSVIGAFLAEPDLAFRAICDCRADRLQAGETFCRDQGAADFSVTADMFELLDRPDIDAVYIATGNRWHGLGAIYAMRAGKDVYAEKPTTMAIGEGRAVVETARRYGAVFQGGHQRRSVDACRFVADTIQRGRIGKPLRARLTAWPTPVVKEVNPMPVPPGFDYDRWLGQSPMHPFSWERTNGWRCFWDTGGGMFTDMLPHWTDLLAFCLDRDHTMPVDYEGTAEWPTDAVSDCPITCNVTARYEDGFEVNLSNFDAFEKRQFRIEGEEGWIEYVDHGGNVLAEPASILADRGQGTSLYTQIGGHIRDFLDAIKTRGPTIDPAEAAHRATATIHAANIAVRLNRRLRFNPSTERFDDAAANQLLQFPVRAPWSL